MDAEAHRSTVRLSLIATLVAGVLLAWAGLGLMCVWRRLTFGVRSTVIQLY